MVDFPENCAGCDYWGEGETDCICVMRDKIVSEHVSYQTKPDWCPIKPIPKKRYVMIYIEGDKREKDSAFAQGWNACIDEIIGGNDG